MRSLRPTVVLPVIVLLAACSGATTGPTADPSSITASDRPIVSVDPATVPPSGPPVTGEVPPDRLQGVLEDLTARIGADASGATVVVAEAVQWPDGSLGCPQPDVMYTQAIVPGYRVVIEFDGATYDYRLSEAGELRLCENVGPSGG